MTSPNEGLRPVSAALVDVEALALPPQEGWREQVSRVGNTVLFFVKNPFSVAATQAPDRMSDHVPGRAHNNLTFPLPDVRG